MNHYVIRVKGRLSHELTSAFPTMTAESEPALTILHGRLDDQAALSGLLNHLDMLGIDIVEVMQVPPLRPDESGRPESDRSLPNPGGSPPSPTDTDRRDSEGFKS